MNLFSDIERLSGENFSSAVIRHLALRSTQIREVFIDLLSAKAPDGPIASIDHFAISLEKTTKDGDKTGRVDLIIEVDDAVIGIENKFNVAFQEGQPEGYLTSVEEHRNMLAKLKGFQPESFSVLQAFILVLAPQRREQEIREELSKTKTPDKYVYCSWEELLQAFTGVHLTDQIDKYLVKQLNDFVKDRTGFPPDIARILPHLSKKFPPRGSDLQKRFVNLLWYSIPEEFTKRYSWGAGAYHCGYYLNTEDANHIWYGFISRESFDEPGQGAAFILAAKTQYATIDDLKEVKIENWDKYGWRCWEVEFKDDWIDRETWEKIFRDFTKRFPLPQKPIQDIQRS
jgi:hypothetical protein